MSFVVLFQRLALASIQRWFLQQIRQQLLFEWFKTALQPVHNVEVNSKELAVVTLLVLDALQQR